MQTWFNFDLDITDAAIDQWRDRLRSRVRADGRHFEHMFIYMIHRNVLWNCQCNSMHVTAIFVVNIISWICVHMHFRCFDFHKVVQRH